MTNDYKQILNFFTGTFSYWDSLEYKRKVDYYFQASNSKFQITINYYLYNNVWRSKGEACNKFLLELGIKTKTDSEYVMTMVTPYKGKPFDDAKTLINYVFDYLKEDEEYQKLLRENKLNRILN